MSYLLFLDDERNPPDTEAAMGLEVVVARSPREFVRAVTERGAPKVVCFDFNLGPGQPDGREMAGWLVHHDRGADVLRPDLVFVSQSLNKEMAREIMVMIRKRLVEKFGEEAVDEAHRENRRAVRKLLTAVTLADPHR